MNKSFCNSQTKIPRVPNSRSSYTLLYTSYETNQLLIQPPGDLFLPCLKTPFPRGQPTSIPKSTRDQSTVIGTVVWVGETDNVPSIYDNPQYYLEGRSQTRDTSSCWVAGYLPICTACTRGRRHRVHTLLEPHDRHRLNECSPRNLKKQNKI